VFCERELVGGDRRGVAWGARGLTRRFYRRRGEFGMCLELLILSGAFREPGAYLRRGRTPFR
jgi:hypothetical protein